LKRFLFSWGDVTVAGLVAAYGLFRAYTLKDAAATGAEETTIIVIGALFYISVRLMWKFVWWAAKRQKPE